MFQRPSSTLATRKSLEGNSPSGTAAELWAVSPDVTCLATLDAPPVLVVDEGCRADRDHRTRWLHWWYRKLRPSASRLAGRTQQYTQLQLAIPQCNHRVRSVYLLQGPSLNTFSSVQRPFARCTNLLTGSAASS